MERRSANEVWERIAAAAGDGGRGVVATDADGTLWDGDVGDDLLHAFIAHGRVEPAADAALRQEARSHDVSDAGTGAEVARAIFDAYEAGRFPEERLYELTAWCFAGWPEEEVQRFARGVVQERGVEGRLHGEVLGVLRRAMQAGLEVLVVSASPLAVVVEAAACAGLGGLAIIAATPRYGERLMRPEVERPIPYGPSKIARLRERVGAERPLVAAFGDNAFDVALLSAARVPVAVRPKPRLRQLADQVPGLLELSPEPACIVPSQPPLP